MVHARRFREVLDQPVTLRRLHLVAVLRRRRLVRLVHDHKVPGALEDCIADRSVRRVRVVSGVALGVIDGCDHLGIALPDVARDLARLRVRVDDLEGLLELL